MLHMSLNPAIRAASDGQHMSFDRSFRISIPAEQGARILISYPCREELGRQFLYLHDLFLNGNWAKPQPRRRKQEFSFHLISSSLFGVFLSLYTSRDGRACTNMDGKMCIKTCWYRHSSRPSVLPSSVVDVKPSILDIYCSWVCDVPISRRFFVTSCGGHLDPKKNMPLLTFWCAEWPFFCFAKWSLCWPEFPQWASDTGSTLSSALVAALLSSDCMLSASTCAIYACTFTHQTNLCETNRNGINFCISTS
jgi:hypothetical protein